MKKRTYMREIDPRLVQISSCWSVRVGKYQVWYTIRAEDHEIPDTSDMTTVSYYLDESPGKMHATHLTFFSFNPNSPHRNNDAHDNLWRVTRRGRIAWLGTRIQLQEEGARKKKGTRPTSFWVDATKKVPPPPKPEPQVTVYLNDMCGYGFSMRPMSSFELSSDVGKVTIPESVWKAYMDHCTSIRAWKRFMAGLEQEALDNH